MYCMLPRCIVTYYIRHDNFDYMYFYTLYSVGEGVFYTQNTPLVTALFTLVFLSDV